MPNWSFNKNLFYSKNKEIIIDLYYKINKWTIDPDIKPDRDCWDGDPTWIGNLLIQSGLDKNEVCAGKYGNCRGTVDEVDGVDIEEVDGEKYYYLVCYTRTAWCQRSLVWIELLKHLYGDNYKEIGYSWTGEEDGCNYYEYYDENQMMLKLLGDFAYGEYYFDSYVGSESKYYEAVPEYSDFMAKDDVILILQDILQKRVPETDIILAELTVNELLEEEDPDFYVHITKVCKSDTVAVN